MRFITFEESNCELHELNPSHKFTIIGCPISKQDVINAAKVLSEEALDAKLNTMVGAMTSNYNIFVFPPGLQIQICTIADSCVENKQKVAVVGTHRQSWITPSSIEHLEDEVTDFSNYLQKEVYLPTLNVDNQLIRASSDVLLSFTLCNSDVRHGHWFWNFTKFESEWLPSTIQQLKHSLHIKIESQVIYDCDLTLEPVWNPEVSRFVFDENQLAFFVNHEWDVDPINVISAHSKANSTSPISIPHVLHFFVYIPPVDFSPLSIEAIRGLSRTFWIPSWGGVLILNKDYPTQNGASVLQGELMEDDYHQLAESFVSQLRMLLDFPEYNNTESKLRTLASLHSAFSDHEVDRILRTKILFNFKSAVHILTAFIQLVDKIQNLEVPDSIRQQVLDSLEVIEQAIDAMVKEEDLIKAAGLVYDGLMWAEAAFSHPSIASIENFPDEHKLGIYLPLFLPVLIVLILTLLQETKKALIKHHGLSSS
eukprot:g715.t1